MISRFPRWAFAALLALYAAAVAGIGLWPFDFQTSCNLCRNGAQVVPGLPGFGFAREGLVLDPGAGPEISRRIAGADGLTVAVLARSDGIFQRGPARMVSLSGGTSARNFTIGQERTRLVLRLRTPVTGPNGSDPATAAPFTVWPGATRLFVATYDGAVFRIFVDGALAAERQLAAGTFAGWDPDFPLVFGNEATGSRPWRGHLFDAAVYGRALAPEEAGALAADDLAGAGADLVYHLGSRCPAAAARASAEGLAVGQCLVPAEYRNVHAWDRLGTARRQLSDYLFNAALWLPLGALAALAGGRRALLLALPLAALAAGVELGQATLFSRTSSAHDLAAALAGLTAGALVAHRRRAR